MSVSKTKTTVLINDPSGGAPLEQNFEYYNFKLLNKRKRVSF